MSTPTRQLGPMGLVSAIGIGAFPRSIDTDAAESAFVDALEYAFDRGITLVDTADAYGADGFSERLVGRALRGRRDKVLVSTKFGHRAQVVVTAAGGEHRPIGDGRPFRGAFGTRTHVNCEPSRISAYLEVSLRRLRLDYVDLYTPHYPDPHVPIEEVVGAIGDLIVAGKVRHIGLSNVNGELLRRAHAVHPIAAVQNLYSVVERSTESDVLPVARELGVGFVSWGPLAIRDTPRLLPIADRAGVGPHELALAWLLHHAPDVVPIPGMDRADLVDANLRALELELDAGTVAALDDLPWRPDERPWLEDYHAAQG